MNIFFFSKYSEKIVRELFWIILLRNKTKFNTKINVTSFGYFYEDVSIVCQKLYIPNILEYINVFVLNIQIIYPLWDTGKYQNRLSFWGYQWGSCYFPWNYETEATFILYFMKIVKIAVAMIFFKNIFYWLKNFFKDIFQYLKNYWYIPGSIVIFFVPLIYS